MTPKPDPQPVPSAPKPALLSDALANELAHLQTTLAQREDRPAPPEADIPEEPPPS